MNCSMILKLQMDMFHEQSAVVNLHFQSHYIFQRKMIIHSMVSQEKKDYLFVISLLQWDYNYQRYRYRSKLQIVVIIVWFFLNSFFIDSEWV